MYRRYWWIVAVLCVGGALSPAVAVVEDVMNAAMNPCRDFYEYACGRWPFVNRDVEHGDTLSLLDMAMNENVAGYLESARNEGVLAKMKTFYRSCRNLKNYNLSEFLDVVKPKAGWAARENTWQARDFDWLQTIAELRKYAVQVFLEQTVMPKWDNTSINIIYLDVVKMYRSSRDTFVKKLRQASVAPAKAETIANELVAFEAQLSEVVPRATTAADNDDSEEVVLGYLSEVLPHIDWNRYLAIVFGKELDPYTPMIIQNSELMTKLVEFLEKSDRSLICNYVMVKVLQFLDQHSIDDPTPNDCVSTLHHSMPLAVGNLVEHHFYDPDYDQMVLDLFNTLKVEFLAEGSKLYEKQRDVLLFLYTKASVMDLQVGNAKRNLSLDAVARYYDGLTFEENRFYTNLLSAFKYKTHKERESLRGAPVELAYQWTATPSPFFVQSKNRIVVPLSLLQESILRKDSAEKYSVLGFILGHEFLHGFDVTGVNYDYEGSMVESAISRNRIFYERVQCVENELHAKGVGEKIADLGGIRLAFNAYRRSLVQVGKSITTKESGAKRTLGQAFFIEFAQFFCGLNTKDTQRHSGPNIHEPDELRVMQSLMHFEEFATAFSCPPGAAMNPGKKCRVW